MKMKMNRCGSRGSSGKDNFEEEEEEKTATMKMKMNRCGNRGSSGKDNYVFLLPQDIIVAILLPVPPRSLLRLKLVCKSWCSLIAHPDFIQLHLDHSITNKKPSILISILNYETKRHVLHSLNYYYYNDDDDDDDDDDGVRLDPIPHSTTVGQRRYWGSCNGLLYLKTTTEHSGLCIWNPCTLEYLRVPHIKLEAHLTNASFGFGYDATTDYYKLIRIKSFYLTNPNVNGGSRQQLIETQALVYTLGSTTWEAIGTVPFEVSSKKDLAGLFFNGGLHWIAIETGSGRGMIICIDIASEEYREISKPESVSISRRDLMCVNSNVKLIVLKGLLCITNLVTTDDDEKSSIEVWAMKDYYYNEPSSWSKLFTIKEPLLALPYPELQYFELLSDICSKDGDEIVALRTTNKWSKSLVWYNMKNDKTRTIVENTDQDVFQFVQVQTCIESLVPLNTGYYNLYSLEETIEEEEERQRMLRPWKKKQKKNSIYLGCV